MTLPGSRRPKEVEEEIRAARIALEEDARPKLVFRTSKTEIFRKTMEQWYMGLSEKQKRRCSPKELKRKAVSVCYTNGIVYDTLPNDWISQLQTKCGLVLHEKVKKTLGSTDSKLVSKCPVPTESAVAGNGSKRKIFLDYTQKQPPPAWLKAYATDVKILPRVLLLVSTGDANILCYDYDPIMKDALGRRVKLEAKPRAPELENVFCEHIVRKRNSTRPGNDGLP